MCINIRDANDPTPSLVTMCSWKIQIKLTNVNVTIAINVILIWLQMLLIWLHITYIPISKELLKIVNLTVNVEQKIKFNNT